MDKSIGDLFRDYGEDYIKIYKPHTQAIKLIRSIRLCKTPALGGKAILCKDCGAHFSIYFSCGNSQCPLCQHNKREKWKEKLSDKLLNVPYTHTVFTIPHQLNPLCKLYKKQMYNIIMRASAKTIKVVAAKEENVGALPGMISVLHTFGSDMKFHLHVHALITFGGVDTEGNWKWPKRKKKIAPYREICKTFKDIFIEMMHKEFHQGEIIPPIDISELISEVESKRWNVRNGYPTTDLNVLENYLARYINRIAVSKSRFEYLAKEEKVNLIYNQYKNQKDGEAAPKSIKTMLPLEAINQFMMHLLPPYFQKSRYTGLHHHSSFKKYKGKMDKKLLRNKDSISNLFSILLRLLKVTRYKCSECQSIDFEIKELAKDQEWIFHFITLPNSRGQPSRYPYIKRKSA